MSEQRHVLVASNYNTLKYPYSAQAYEVCSVVSQCETSTLLAPETRVTFQPGILDRNLLTRELIRRGETKLRQIMGRPDAPVMKGARLSRDYDLLFYVCQFMGGLADVERIEGWRERCRLKVAFVLESWSTLMQRNRTNLRLLDDFDHVFVLNRASIKNLRRYTKTPVSFLPTGSDALLFRPSCLDAPRPIDVYSMGRRPPKLHQQLRSLVEGGRFFYVYDAWSNGTVADWADARALTRAYIQRSRYFVAYGPDIGNPIMTKQANGEQTLSSRYFEGAAGGAVMLGSTPGCSEFDELFDWPDAVIPIPESPDDIGAILADLDGQPARLARIRADNVRQSLLRHDWAYRWQEVLRTLDLAPMPALEERLGRLHQAAALVPPARELMTAG